MLVNLMQFVNVHTYVATSNYAIYVCTYVYTYAQNIYILYVQVYDVSS